LIAFGANSGANFEVQFGSANSEARRISTIGPAWTPVANESQRALERVTLHRAPSRGPASYRYDQQRHPETMKRLRYQRPTLGLRLIMALAIGTVAVVFGYYGILAWRFFFD
jgi:hypothetical protein